MERARDQHDAIEILGCKFLAGLFRIGHFKNKLGNKLERDILDALQVFLNVLINLACCIEIERLPCKARDAYGYMLLHGFYSSTGSCLVVFSTILIDAEKSSLFKPSSMPFS